MDWEFTQDLSMLQMVALILLSLITIACKLFSRKMNDYLSRHKWANLFYDPLMYLPLFWVINEFCATWIAVIAAIIIAFIIDWLLWKFRASSVRK